MKSRKDVGLLLAVTLGILACGVPGKAHAEINSSSLAQNGWYSDDTRADGTGSEVAGTNLVSDTLTDDPEATASGTPAHDADIVAQLPFGAAPGATPGGTHPGAVHLSIAPGSGSGKSQISHRKDDGTGHAPGSAFGPAFLAEYSWMGDGTVSVTASLKLGVKTADFGSTGVSSRTGENAWDKVMIYEPGNLNGGTSDGLWHTETVDYTTGKWWFFDRTAGAGTIGTPMTLSDMAGALGAATLVGGGPKTVQDVYNLITDAGAHITSVQFGIGSGNAGDSIYVNQVPPVHNLTQATNHATIQDAVDNATSGDMIAVDPGTYVEQVIVDGLDLTITGAGKASTFIHAPALLATAFTTSASNKPVVACMNTASVTIDGFTIDGLGVGNANNRFEGVAFYNAGGAVLNCDVTRIRDTPASGVQHGIGIYSFNNTGGPYALEVGSCDVYDYQKNAMALSGDGMVVDVHDCNTTGAGDIAYTAQNGIQVGFGAGGSVTDCTVSDMRYTPATTVASGLLIYGGTTVDVSNVSLVDVQESVYFQDTAGTIDGVDVSFAASQPDYDGIFVYNATSARAGRSLASVDPVFEVAAARSALQTPISVSITNSCITGPGIVGTYGLSTYSGGETLTVTASGLTITGFDYGVAPGGAANTLDITSSSISGNLTAGYDNSGSGAAQNAELNWWGAADGPSGDGAGSGDAVTGGAVSFSPFLTDGSSATVCAFTPSGNTVTPDPGPDPCVSTINPCIPVAFDIDRTDNAGVRGFSVTFTLSSELELCSGLASITEGTYLNSVGTTILQKLDNGGGSYTVDGSILGLPCGVTAATGNLFDIAVQAAGGDGTGTITITEVLLRDCANGPLPADAGAAAIIPVDATAPVAVAGLTATQVKTGNDSDGTTGITVNFTAPGDAVAVEVWRKGFGDYPEYDDASGAVPTIPATPAAALGDGWTLTSVAVDGDVDETTARDFYYFVIFTEDACGNVSTVSNMTGGTLNYHLGDVSDGITPVDGDNVVSTADMSLLGSNYGATLAFNDPVNYLDVGPTSNLSVDAFPNTDNQVEFEDLMMFAINFGQVSRSIPGPPVAAALNVPVLRLQFVETGEADVIAARIVLDDNEHSVKGIHSRLDWDASRLELLGVTQGELLSSQSAPVFFKDLPANGEVVVDAASLGQRSVIEGSGLVAEVRFRVLSDGARPELGLSVLRDLANRPAGRRSAVVDAGDAASGDVGTESEVELATPGSVRIIGAQPNPFDRSTDIVLALPQSASVTLDIFDVTGRRVRNLVNRTLAAGETRVTWDGRGDDGRVSGAGIYFYRIATGDTVETHKLVRTR